MLRYAVVVLLGLLPGCGGVDEDSCKFFGLVQKTPLHESNGVGWELTGEAANACLNKLKISAGDVYHTVMHLEHGLIDLYSYERLAVNSTASVPDLAAGCKLPVHEVSTNLRDELRQVKEDALEQFGLEQGRDFEELLSAEGSIPARPFHNRIEAIFISLQDAHTVYLPPYRLQLVAWYYVPHGRMPAEPGAVTFQVGGLGGGAPPPHISLAYGDGSKWDVYEIEGQPPMDWVRSMSTKWGAGYKSEGARVNSFLKSLGENWFASKPIPRTGKLSLRARKLGTEEERQMVLDVMVTSKLGGFEELQAACSKNERWDALQAWLDASLNLRGPARQEAMARIPTAFGGWELMARHPVERGLDFRVRAKGREREAPAAADGQLHLDAGRRLAEATEIFRWPDRDEWTPPRDLPYITAYDIPSQDTSVLKITSFVPPPGLSMHDMIAKVLKGHYLLRKRERSRLILDLVDNGGGQIEAANVLIATVAPRLGDNKTDLCANYRTLINPFWQEWLDSFGGKTGQFEQLVDSMGAEDITDFIERLEALSKLEAVIGAKVPIYMGKVTELKYELETGSPTLGEKRAMVLEFLTHVLLLTRLGTRALVAKGDADGGWFPFDGDVEDPETGGRFAPPMKPYRELESHMWGGVEGNYSMPYIRLCSEAFSKSLDRLVAEGEVSSTSAKKQWKEIAVVTNGLCGSACSLVASKLQFAEGATIFTYGGVPGELMDSSAFAGGNVEHYEFFWPNVLYAALIGDIVFGPQTKIGERLRAPGARERHYAKTLPLPLPTQAIATFNFNMMFITELGSGALPREFYNLPAHKHYDEWHATTFESASWGPLQELYAKIAKEDWAELRKGGRFANGTEDVVLGCAADPPTESWTRPRDPWEEAGGGGRAPGDGDGQMPGDGDSGGQEPGERPGSAGRFNIWAGVAVVAALCVLGVACYGVYFVATRGRPPARTSAGQAPGPGEVQMEDVEQLRAEI